MKFLAGAVVLFSTFAVAATAAPAVTATLSAPVAKERTVMAGGGVFRCADVTCTLVSDSSVMPLSVCRDLTRTVGAVTTIATPRKTLTGDRLAACVKK